MSIGLGGAGFGQPRREAASQILPELLVLFLPAKQTPLVVHIGFYSSLKRSILQDLYSDG